MALYNKETRLTEALMAHPRLIPVIDRLGVTLGVGDETIGKVCVRHDVDPSFFLSIVNTFIDEQYFPANPRDTFTLEKTIDYLEKTDRYYRKSQLPNIERHFSSLLLRSGGENNLSLLNSFFQEVSGELTDIMTYDSDVLYPSLRGGNIPADYMEMAVKYSEIMEKLHDLLYFFVAQLKGEYDHNLCMAVVSAIFSLERDIRQNNRIRERILLPIIREKMAERGME